jgi:serine/threonine-protein kinase
MQPASLPERQLSMIEFGPFRYDPEARLLCRDDDEIVLPMRVVAVLESFLKRPGRIVEKGDILASAWEGAFVGEDSLTQAVSQLRSALGDDPHRPTYIQTIPKRGYRFIAEVSQPLQSSAPVPRPTGEGDKPEILAAAPPAALPRTSSPEPKRSVTAKGRAPTFAAGELVSHYELVARIGAGAMGEVWRARDTELRRDVAIKVVPDDLADEAAVIQRFRREALMLAAVNHPNIATIYGVEQVNETRFIVMELLEGETLQNRLEQGALPPDSAVDIAVQIALALKVAHDAGIVHRDLKPGNVMIGAQGQVKVLDFGLAKDARSNDRSTDTDQTVVSAAGLPIGTAAYMSPEQAAGKPIDNRSDIFSFGCLVFEMLAGQRPFSGTTASEVVAGILKDEPDWEGLPDAVHRPVRRLLCRCLAKNPDQRFHDIADVRIELEQLPEDDAPLDPPRRGTSGRLAWAVAAASLTIAVLVVVTDTRPGNGLFEPDSEPRPQLVKAEINLPQDAPMAPPGSFIYGIPSRSLALSPDGKTLVYVAWRDGSRHELWRRDMTTGDFAPIEGTLGAYAPFFDPSGEQLGFFADDSLKTISVAGSRSRWLADVVWGRGGAWGEDGFIYFTPNQMTGVHRVSVSGSGEVRQITTSGTLATHDWPGLAKGRSALVFNAGNSIVRVDLDRPGEPETMVPYGARFAYTDNGYFLWVAEGVLMAAPLDTDGLPQVDAATPLLDDVAAGGWRAVLADLAGSTLVYAPGELLEGNRSFVWKSRDGSSEPLPLPAASYGDFQISPDGKLLAYTGNGVWLVELNDPQARPIKIMDEGNWPEWDPPGEHLYFTVGGWGGALFRHDLTRAGGAPVEVIARDLFPGGTPGPVAKAGLIYYEIGEAPLPDIYFIPFEDDGLTPRLDAIRPIVATPGQDIFPSVSPDGRWIAYQSDSSGANEIYVVSLEEPRGPEKISHGGGVEPRWNADGDSIVYQKGNGLYEVAFSSEPDIELGSPDLVATGPFADVGGWGWDIDHDGSRFLVFENAALGEPIAKLTVITGFLGLLERTVPTAGRMP